MIVSAVPTVTLLCPAHRLPLEHAWFTMNSSLVMPIVLQFALVAGLTKMPKQYLKPPLTGVVLTRRSS